MVDRWMIVCAGLAAGALPGTAFAQSEDAPRTAMTEPAETAQTADPAAQSRLGRIVLGNLVAIGTVGITLGLPVAYAIPFASGSPSGGTVFTVAFTLGGVATALVVPAAYVLAADAFDGRGRYWATLVGWVVGVGLGALAIPASLATSSSSGTANAIVSASVLMPVLGLVGQSLGYELSMGPPPRRDVAQRRRRPVLPLVTATADGVSLSIGGTL
jgi:MFS family permease